MTSKLSLSLVPGVAYLLVVELVVFSVFDASFASVPNALNIGLQSATLMLLALPMTLIIMSEGLDLSMGAVLGLAGVVLAMVLVRGGHLAFACAAALAVGAVFGVTNGVLVVTLGFRRSSRLSGTLGIAQGLALVLTGGQSVVGIGDAPGAMRKPDRGRAVSIVIALAAFLAFWLMLSQTRVGSYVSALAAVARPSRWRVSMSICFTSASMPPAG